MSKNTVTVNQNAHKWEIEGTFDLSAAAAVSNLKCDGATISKTGVGTYALVLKGNAALKLVETLRAQANFWGTSPTGALGVRISDISQNSTTEDVTITFKTSLNPTSGADTDVTGATKVSFHAVIRFGKLDHPLRS